MNTVNVPQYLRNLLGQVPETNRGSVVVAQSVDQEGNPIGAPFQRFAWTKRDELPMRLASCWVPLPPPDAQLERKRGKSEGDEDEHFLVFRVQAQWVKRGEGDRAKYICLPLNPQDCDQTEWLFGKSWTEMVGRTWQYTIIDRKSGEEKSLTFCRSKWFGRSVMLHNGLKEGDAMFVSPGPYLVCHGHAAERPLDLGIILLEEDEALVVEDDPLYVVVGGKTFQVAELLGFVQWEPESPPTVTEISDRYDREYLRACAGLRAATEPLVQAGKLRLTAEGVEESDLEAQRLIAGLAEARDKLVAYSETKQVHAPAPTSSKRRTDWREIIETAALSRSKPRHKPKTAKEESQLRPGENITAAMIVDNIKNARKHGVASKDAKEKLAAALVKAGFPNAFRLRKQNVNTLREAVVNRAEYSCAQGLAQAILDSTKKLLEQESREKVKKAAAAGDVKV